MAVKTEAGFKRAFQAAARKFADCPNASNWQDLKRAMIRYQEVYHCSSPTEPTGAQLTS